MRTPTGIAILVLIPVLGVAALSGCRGGGERAEGSLIPVEAAAGTVWRGDHGRATERAHVVARDAGEWTALWARVGESAPSALPGGSMAVAVFLGPRDSGGYGVAIERAQAVGGDLVIGYRETVPGPAMAVTMARTSPYAVRLIPAAAGTPKFVMEK